MNKDERILLLLPFSVLLCSLLVLFFREGLPVLLIWLFRDLMIPILHFTLIGKYWKRDIPARKVTLIASVVLLILMQGIDSAFLKMTVMHSRLVVLLFLFKLIWIVIIGLVMILHRSGVGLEKNGRRHSILLGIGAGLILAINALFSFYVSPILATTYAIDGGEIILLFVSFILLSMYSFVLGRRMDRNYLQLKMAVWFVGIAISVFIACWLMGTPHKLPTENLTTTILWLGTTAVAFLFTQIGANANWNEGKK